MNLKNPKPCKASQPEAPKTLQETLTETLNPKTLNPKPQTLNSKGSCGGSQGSKALN